MLPQDTQEFKGWQRIFKAGLEAGLKGIQLQEGVHPAAQEGAALAAEIEARRCAAEAREAQRRQAELNRTLPPAGAKISDDGLWLV